MARSIKKAVEIFRVARFNVLSFNKEGLRHSSYGNVDMVTALREVAYKTRAGFRVLILDPERDESANWEKVNKSRIPYEEALKWAIDNEHPLLKASWF